MQTINHDIERKLISVSILLKSCEAILHRLEPDSDALREVKRMLSMAHLRVMEARSYEEIPHE